MLIPADGPPQWELTLSAGHHVDRHRIQILVEYAVDRTEERKGPRHQIGAQAQLIF